MVTMQKYLIDLQAKGVTVPPPEFKLSNLIDLYTQIETLEAESKLYAGIIRQLNDDNKATQAQCERLADALDNLIIQLSCFVTMPPAVKQAEHEAREELEEYRLSQEI